MPEKEEKSAGYREAERRIEECRKANGTMLDLRGLSLTSLPLDLGMLTALQTLDLGSNQLISLPENFENLTELRWLDLGKNKLASLPEGVGMLRALESLYLHFNQLTSLPEGMVKLTALRSLNLSGNPLKSLPEGLGELTSLRKLGVTDNELTSLPEGLGKLVALQSLFVSRNQLTSLQDWLGKLTELQTLDLSDNKITTLPKGLEKLTALQKLRLSGNQLTTLPEELGKLTKLTTLDLSSNGLTSLPEIPVKLTALQTLDLSRNRLVSLPNWLVKLISLQTLHVSRNGLTSLPDGLGKLMVLRTLNLFGNDLTSLPNALGKLTTLQTLNLCGNNLLSLPDALGNLTQLQTLNLSYNNLTNLPDVFGKLTALQSLDLSNNKLGSLPSRIVDLTHLEELYLHDNSSLCLPEEVIGPKHEEVRYQSAQPKPPAEILDYYFRILRGKPLHEARIIVIGDGASGKTSLIRQLLHASTARPREATTCEVVIETWPITLRKKKIAVHVWDFGGQEPMHAAHPYFFTERTLYLVVASARETGVDERIDYWLKMVAKYGKGARALVVVNKVDEHRMDVKARDLCARHPESLPMDVSQAFYGTSCTTGEGIVKLSAGITRELEGMEQIWALTPPEWFKVKECLAKMRGQNPTGLAAKVLKRFFSGSVENADTLTQEDWRRICQEGGVVTEQDRDALLSLLRALGFVVSFPGDARLSALGVLNPEWVTRAIYPLLTSPKLAEAGGLLTLEDLRKLLPRDKYPEHRLLWLIDLLKEFELLFADESGQWLLPARLPKDTPEWALNARWAAGADQGTLHLELRYEVLLESVISRFIVREHSRRWQPGSWWRHGIALREGDCDALVKAQLTENTIELHINGPKTQRPHFISGLRHTLEELGKRLGGELWIILPGGHAEKYHDLLVLANGGKREIERAVKGRVQTYDLIPILDLVEPRSEQAASMQSIANNQNHYYMGDTYNTTMRDAHGSVIGSGQVTNSGSFNQGLSSPELASLLSALRQEVKNLPPEEAESVELIVEKIETDAKTLEDEEKKEKPNRSLLTLTRKGLVDAAKACAEMAPSLVKAATAVAQWYATGGRS